MRHVETSQKVGILVIVIIVAMAGVFAWRNWISPPETNAEKYTECTKTAGEMYDTTRKAIAERNPDKSTHEHYYRMADDTYAKDLANCRNLYSE